MAQLLVRNIPDRTVMALKERAARHGRSVEAEHRAILDEVLVLDELNFVERAELLRAKTRGRSRVPSWVLIREDRDSR
jgi:plasmid stability protein